MLEKQTPPDEGRRCADGDPAKIEAQHNLPAIYPQATRRRLDNWRESEIRSFEFEGRAYRASVSRFPDGTIGEVFLDCSKYGSDVAVHANESAILASLALQLGAKPEELCHSIGGPIAAALRLFAEAPSA